MRIYGSRGKKVGKYRRKKGGNRGTEVRREGRKLRRQ